MCTSDLLALLGAELTEPLVAVDVGARWGIGDRWAGLGDQVHVFGFDPDSEECARLNLLAPTGVEYVPMALADLSGPRTLYLTTEPACSSFFEPLPRIAQAYPELACTALDQISTTVATTLDAWSRSRNVARVDVMKLDTQGSELGVLEGARTLLPAVQLLEVEVEFNPIYDGQPLFGDVDRFLRREGFALWKLAHHVHYSSLEVPGVSLDVPDLRFYDSVAIPAAGGGGQLYWAHAYFVRAELSLSRSEAPDWPQAVRAACAALAFGLPDVALVALRKAAQNVDQFAVLHAVRVGLGLEPLSVAT